MMLTAKNKLVDIAFVLCDTALERRKGRGWCVAIFFLKHDTALERLGNDSGELLQLRLERDFDHMSSLTY
jgi:hypothetical protein